MDKKTVGLVEIIIASLLFGFIPLVVRYDTHLGPYNLAFFRVAVAALGIFLFLKIAKNYTLQPFKSEKIKLIFFGAIHGFIILGYFFAIKYLSIASAVLLLYSAAIWIVVFSWLILKEKITPRTIIGLIVAFIGLIIIVSPKEFFVNENIIGSIAGLLAGIGFGLVYVLSKTFKKYDKVSLTFWQNFFAIPFTIPLLLIDFPKVFTLTDAGLIILLSIFFTAIPFILVFRGFEKINAQKGGVVILLDIIFPILLGLLIFKEIPTVSNIIGGVLIIIGVVIVTKN